MNHDSYPLPEVEAVQTLLAHKLTVATVESCTGGLVASRLTDVPGSSSVFHSGWVTYSNEVKHREMGVPLNILEEYGAVSPQVAEAMAVGALGKSGADIAVSLTGFAGPGGGTEDVPVGTVWMAIATRNYGQYLFRAYIPDVDRSKFKECAADIVLAAIAKVPDMEGVRTTLPHRDNIKYSHYWGRP